ncbi:MAG: PrsW family intramembrane metalloprotease [Treponema sp.]|jgi:RsiW-degrading membrane proteinase PrsW (M82 family)|nr:PrsW family intramembrane metalloprotease [Treponema sp.]
MSGTGVLLLLIFISALPVILAILWFRLSRFPLSLLRCLCALLAGAAALFPALLLQRLFLALMSGPGGYEGRWGPMVRMFGRIALTEELSRLLALFVFFLMAGDFKKTYPLYPERNRDRGPAGTGGMGAAAWGSAAGLLAGLGFSIVENAAYGAADFRLALPRTFITAPLHGACGARIGSALLTGKERPRSAVFRFFSAVLIHGVYNAMIARAGISVPLGVLIALFALASSVLEIRGGQ